MEQRSFKDAVDLVARVESWRKVQPREVRIGKEVERGVVSQTIEVQRVYEGQVNGQTIAVGEVGNKYFLAVLENGLWQRFDKREHQEEIASLYERVVPAETKSQEVKKAYFWF